MSSEFLLLLIAIVLLPLVQQLLGALRQQRTPERRTNQTRGEQPEQRSSVHEPFGHRPESPRVTVNTRDPLTNTVADESAAALEAAASTPPDSPVLPSSRRHPAVAGLRSSRGLRRSIVLMTILGPCRSIDPYAWLQYHDSQEEQARIYRRGRRTP